MTGTTADACWIGGAVLFAWLIYDVFITVLSLGGAGPLTRFWTRFVWQGLLAVHQRKRMHRLLSLIGPSMLLGSIVVWYLMLFLAGYLIFASRVDAVVNNTTGEPADLLQKVYFVGSTVSGLGYGDLVPNGAPWTFISSAATFWGTVVLTLSLSYVLSVLAAAIERRALAQSIFGVGSDIQSFLDNARLGEPEASLRTHILSIVSQLDRHAHKHLSYPILHFFHAPRRELSTSRAVLLLADTCFMLSHVMPPEKRPSQGLLHLLDGSIDSFVEHGSRQVDTNRPNDGDVDALRATALELNAEIESAQLEQALLAYQVRRSQLIAACRQDGWDMS